MVFTRIPRPGRIGVALGLITASNTLAHQAAAQAPSDSSRTVIAHHLTIAPRIDGRLDDPAWRTIPSRRDFVVFAPHEGGTPDFPNEAWIGYDDGALTAWAERIRAQPWQRAFVFFKHEEGSPLGWPAVERFARGFAPAVPALDAGPESALE